MRYRGDRCIRKLEVFWYGLIRVQGGRARPNGAKTNRLLLFSRKTKMEYKQAQGIHTREKHERKRANGQGGVPAVMHHLAAAEAAPSPEQRGDCAHTAIAGNNLLLQWCRCSEARDLRWIECAGAFKKASSFATTRVSLLHCSTQFEFDGHMGHCFGCGDENFFWLAPAACCSRIV